MKIRPEDLEILKGAIAPIDTPERRAQYRAGDFRGADKVKDLNMRYRWDLLYTAGLQRFLSDELYAYMNDTHIDTALRHVVPAL